MDINFKRDINWDSFSRHDVIWNKHVYIIKYVDIIMFWIIFFNTKTVWKKSLDDRLTCGLWLKSCYSVLVLDQFPGLKKTASLAAWWQYNGYIAIQLNFFSGFALGNIRTATAVNILNNVRENYIKYNI